MKLLRQSDSMVIAQDIEFAHSFFKRGVGLLGRPSLATDTALWIKPCKSIHTLGMLFEIDCIYVDSSLKVVAHLKNITPWRVTKFYSQAESVFETTPRNYQLSVGDQLYVGA